MRETEEACEQCKIQKEEQEKRWKEDNNTKVCTNKAFEKIERFDRSNPERCLPWLDEMFSVIEKHGRNHREELLFNSGRRVQYTLHSISQEATSDLIKDILLRNHSNLKTPSQCTAAYQAIQQKPDEALQTYNTRYESYYQLAHPGLNIDNDTSRVSCIHYANSLHRKLGEEMEGWFNQELPDNLWSAFEKAVNFELRILTKQCINTRQVNEVNHINISSDNQEFEANEAHVRNPNYKGKNYDPNYQKNKQNTNYNTNNSNHSSTGHKGNNYNNRWNFNNAKNDYTEKPSNVEVTLKGPINKEQLFKIQEILRNPRVYTGKLPKGQQPATGEYAKSFNKFCPTKVEVNEATVDDVVKYGHLIKRSEAEMAEAIDIYKTLRDDVFYRPEEQSDEHNSEQQ